MNQRVIHPDVVDRLGKYFPDTCVIQEYTSAPNAVGEPQKTWTDKFTDVQCVVGKDTTSEIKDSSGNVRKSTHRIALMGLYDTNETMRVLLNDEYYDILHSQKDQMSTMSSLVCEKVRL